jgi:hypothetical protein
MSESADTIEFMRAAFSVLVLEALDLSLEVSMRDQKLLPTSGNILSLMRMIFELNPGRGGEEV